LEALGGGGFLAPLNSKPLDCDNFKLLLGVSVVADHRRIPSLIKKKAVKRRPRTKMRIPRTLDCDLNTTSGG
jgi:hypothetical protein